MKNLIAGTLKASARVFNKTADAILAGDFNQQAGAVLLYLLLSFIATIALPFPLSIAVLNDAGIDVNMGLLLISLWTISYKLLSAYMERKIADYQG